MPTIPLAILRDGHVESPEPGRAVIRSVLAGWVDCGHLSRASARKVEADPRALRLAAFVARTTPELPDYDWDGSLDAALVGQAKLLIRARACQLTDPRLAATVLKRASVYAKTCKPMRRALRASIVSHEGMTASTVAGAVRPADVVEA